MALTTQGVDYQSALKMRVDRAHELLHAAMRIHGVPCRWTRAPKAEVENLLKTLDI